MHKDKDGKVIASLTEVKNKTGDIFSVVDEFGEITLTSYNKPRYKITKVSNLDSLIEEKNTEKPKKEKAQKKETKTVQKPKKKAKTKKTAKESKPEKTEVENNNKELLNTTVTETVTSDAISDANEEDEEMLSALSKLQPWDRNSRTEKKYHKRITKSLQ